MELCGDEELIEDETKLRDDNELTEDGTELRVDKVSLENGNDSENGRANTVDDSFGVEGSIDMFGCVSRPRRWCSNHMCGASHCKYSDMKALDSCSRSSCVGGRPRQNSFFRGGKSIWFSILALVTLPPPLLRPPYPQEGSG